MDYIVSHRPWFIGIPAFVLCVAFLWGSGFIPWLLSLGPKPGSPEE